jgi:autoinducer 2-degrading protein
MAILHTAHLRAHPHAVEQYKQRLLRHARISLDAEPGKCLKFEVHQDQNDPTLFFLIEIYRDEAALEAHRTSPHFLAYRNDTDTWVAERKWWYWTPLDVPATDMPK